MAKTTTSVAEVTPSPSEVSANGKSTRATAAMRRSRACGILHASFEALDALAEQAARAHQQDQEHQQIHGRLGELRIAKGHHQPLHQADDHGGNDDTPEGAKAADHHHDEGCRYDLIP